MHTKLFATALAAILGMLTFAAKPTPTPQDGPAKQEADMKSVMEKAKALTQPGPKHKILERFAGKWSYSIEVFAGPKPMPGGTGEAEGTWLMAGRWLQFKMKGTMMRMPLESVTLMGHDNFKQSFVVTTVQNMDTAMNRAEGDLTPDGKALVLYGTIDEYLTGEHDKMVKQAWRFLSDDKMTLEIHDLPIGEQNAKVIEMTFTRA